MSSSIVSLGAALHLLMPAAVRGHGKRKRSRNMPASIENPILAGFQYELRSKVEIFMQQQQQQPESYNFSAASLGQALDVVLFIYSNVKDLYQHVQIDNNNDGKWLSQHMEDLVNLLDVCNMLRESMSEIKKHNMSVQIAIHGLLHAHAQTPSALSHDHTTNNKVAKAKMSLANCMDALRKEKDMESKLVKCMSTLKQMVDSLHSSTEMVTSTGRSGVEEVIKEAKTITIFVLTALVAAFYFNAPCRSFMPRAGFLKKKNRISPNPLPPLIHINSLTNMMQQKLKEAMDMKRKSSSSFKFLLHELNRADVRVGKLNNLLERYIINQTSYMQDEVKDSIHEVSMSITELDSALTHIDQRMNELFRILISSRVTLLNNLSTLSSCSDQCMYKAEDALHPCPHVLPPISQRYQIDIFTIWQRSTSLIFSRESSRLPHTDTIPFT